MVFLLYALGSLLTTMSSHPGPHPTNLGMGFFCRLFLPLLFHLWIVAPTWYQYLFPLLGICLSTDVSSCAALLMARPGPKLLCTDGFLFQPNAMPPFTSTPLFLSPTRRPRTPVGLSIVSDPQTLIFFPSLYTLPLLVLPPPPSRSSWQV